MKLKVIGSSGGESPGHNPPAFLIDGSMLLDAGTIGAFLNEASQWKIHNILITHAHLDHIKGIPFLADNLVIRNKKHSVRVISISRVLMALKKNLLNNRIWPDFTIISTASEPVLLLKPISPGKPFEINGYTITAYNVNHSVPAVGYIIEDRKGRRLLYTGDTGPTDAIWKAARRINCAIIEVSFPNKLKAMAIKSGHLTASLLMEEVKKMKSLPEKILVTHPKPLYLEQIRKEVKNLPLKISILKDGRTYII
ncbi:MAG: 3',5'-cyclic-nucleotide phosphodiesterase [Nitrospirota bacterium]